MDNLSEKEKKSLIIKMAICGILLLAVMIIGLVMLL